MANQGPGFKDQIKKILSAGGVLSGFINTDLLKLSEYVDVWDNINKNSNDLR